MLICIHISFLDRGKGEPDMGTCKEALRHGHVLGYGRCAALSDDAQALG
jgi:hypothetical protein